MQKQIITSTTALLLASSATMAATVVNSGFEGGAVNNSAISAWSNYASATDGWGVGINDGSPSGQNLWLGNNNGVFQTLTTGEGATISLGTYTITLDAAHTADSQGNIILEFFRSGDLPSISGNSVDATALASFEIDTAGTPGNFVSESRSFVVNSTTAGFGTDNIVIGIRESESTNGYVGADNVVVSFTPVPEPTSVALLGLGSIATLLRRRR